MPIIFAFTHGSEVGVSPTSFWETNDGSLVWVLLAIVGGGLWGCWAVRKGFKEAQSRPVVIPWYLKGLERRVEHAERLREDLLRQEERLAREEQVWESDTAELSAVCAYDTWIKAHAQRNHILLGDLLAAGKADPDGSVGAAMVAFDEALTNRQDERENVLTELLAEEAKHGEKSAEDRANWLTARIYELEGRRDALIARSNACQVASKITPEQVWAAQRAREVAGAKNQIEAVLAGWIKNDPAYAQQVNEAWQQQNG